MTPFDAYEMFMAVRLHFTNKSYDFNKYQGRVANLSADKFDMRRDKYHFHKLSKRHDPLLLSVANIFVDPKTWVTDLFNEEAIQRYRRRRKVLDSLQYIISNDLKEYTSIDQALDVSHPHVNPDLLERYIRGTVHPETVIVVHAIYNMFPYWLRELADEYVIPEEIQRLKKYSSFVEFDRTKYQRLLVDMFE